MQPSTMFLCGLGALASTASAHVLPRQDTTTTGNFTLSNVVFSGSLSDGTVNYAFDITDSLGGGSTHCSNAISNNGDISPFGLTGCDDPTWSFAFPTEHPSHDLLYALQIQRFQIIDGHITANETSCTTYDSSYIETVVDGANHYQYFRFPRDPLVQSWSYNACYYG